MNKDQLEKAKAAFREWSNDQYGHYYKEVLHDFIAGAEWAWDEISKRSDPRLCGLMPLQDGDTAELWRDAAILWEKWFNESSEDRKKLQAELSDLLNGMKGACPTCEPVGEMNKRLRECLNIALEWLPSHEAYEEERKDAFDEIKQCLKEINNQSSTKTEGE